MYVSHLSIKAACLDQPSLCLDTESRVEEIRGNKEGVCAAENWHGETGILKAP